MPQQNEAEARGDKLALVELLIREVLHGGDIQALEELTVTVEGGIDWKALGEFLASVQTDYPGLRFRVSRLRANADGVTATLAIMAPIEFEIANGKIVDVQLPEYFLEDIPAPPRVPPEPRDGPALQFDVQLSQLRDEIGNLGIEVAQAVERFGQATRRLADLREERAGLLERAERARESGIELRESQLRARAASLATALASSEEQCNTLSHFVEELLEYRQTAMRALYRLELRAQGLVIRRDLAEVRNRLASGMAIASSVNDTLADTRLRLGAAEEEAAEQLEQARRTYARRIAQLEIEATGASKDVEARLQELQIEISRGATRGWVPDEP